MYGMFKGLASFAQLDDIRIDTNTFRLHYKVGGIRIQAYFLNTILIYKTSLGIRCIEFFRHFGQFFQDKEFFPTL